MNDATKEIHKNSLSANDDIVNTSVSEDGTWQHKGFFSYNGVFAAILVENGKVLDVKPMSSYCKGCNLKKDLKVKNPTAHAEWKNAHICRFNYESLAGGMEAEGAKRVSVRSIDKRKLRYVEYLGDGDTKMYVNVKYTYQGIEKKN